MRPPQEVSTLTSGVCGRNFEPAGCLDAADQPIGQDVISGYIDQVKIRAFGARRMQLRFISL
jgi:hypothetical protein